MRLIRSKRHGGAAQSGAVRALVRGLGMCGRVRLPLRGGHAHRVGGGLEGLVSQALQGMDCVWALAADTDGIDGSEDNAGAFVGPDTLARAATAGLRVEDHLARNDAWGFFAGLDDLLVTGPTHTNVNDFRALLIL